MVDGATSVRAMAAAQGVTAGAIHQHLARAERYGWATAPRDKQTGRWTLTAAGREALRLCAMVSR